MESPLRKQKKEGYIDGGAVQRGGNKVILYWLNDARVTAKGELFLDGAEFYKI